MPYLYESAEKFIKDIFWSESHNKANKLDIPKTVGERLLKDNKEKDPEYYNHREGVVHVTSLTKCLRGVVHEMIGTPKDLKDEKDEARKMGVFKAGNLFEDFIVTALGDKMLDRQTEYVFKYKNLILTGRDDGTILHDGVKTMLENKSVHSDSFWYRSQEGTLIAAHNQQQIQTYLWFRRMLPNVFAVQMQEGEKLETIYTNLSELELKEFKKGWTGWGTIPKPDNSQLNGIFCYISKDDCTIAQGPVKFNQRIVDEVIIPALDAVVAGYEKRDPASVPAPALTRYEESKHQHQVNWVCKYCDYHTKCAGAGWLMEAQGEVKRKNAEQTRAMVNKFAVPAPKPIIGVDTGLPGGDKTVTVQGIQKADGTVEIQSVKVSESAGVAVVGTAPETIKPNS